MAKTINISLSSKSINHAIVTLESYRRGVLKKTMALARELALIGLSHASGGFATATYDGNNDVIVFVESTETGYRIVAEGEAVAFIEFGAGVARGYGYPGTKPPEIASIGEYGKGRGKRMIWGFYDSDDNLVLTSGNPPHAPMYGAVKEIHARVESIARRIFASD